MDGEQILHLVNSSDTLKETFRGVFPKDILGSWGSMLEGCYILNCCPGFLPGKHWLSFYKPCDPSSVPSFFDSLGHPPSYYEMIFPNEPVILYNDRRLQASGTATCALYCLYFLFYSNLGADMEEIVNVFCEDKIKNDRIVSNFAEGLLSGRLHRY